MSQRRPDPYTLSHDELRQRWERDFAPRVLVDPFVSPDWWFLIADPSRLWELLEAWEKLHLFYGAAFDSEGMGV